MIALFPLIGAIAAALTLTGCATSAPAHFYVLNPVHEGAVEFTSQTTVGVGPVVIPAYLDQPQMVRRATANRLDVNEFDRWGGPLQQDLTRVIAQNLSGYLRTPRVVTYPWETAVPVDYQVTADIRRFDAAIDGDVHLEAVWAIFRDGGRRLVHMTQASIRVPVLGEDLDAVVRAQSDAVGELSEAIAHRISEMSGRPSAL